MLGIARPFRINDDEPRMNEKKTQTDKKDKQESSKKGSYSPEKFNPDDYSVQTYLYDTNQLLTDINTKLKVLIQLIAAAQDKDQKTEKEKAVRTIGMTRE